MQFDKCILNDRIVIHVHTSDGENYSLKTKISWLIIFI